MVHPFWLILAALFTFALVGGGLSLAPWVPTRKKDFERINTFIGLKEGERLYELGCGDGRVSHYLAKRNPQAKIVGIEISPLLFALAKIRLLLSPLPNLRFIRANLFAIDLSDGDVFYTFGMHGALTKLHERLAHQAGKPARLISYAFHLPGHEPTHTNGKRGHQTLLFEYKIMKS